MATIPPPSASSEVDYPTSDGRPMAETDLHRDRMLDLIVRVQDWFAADPQVYVSGNLLLFYERGNKRKHVAPDLFVVRGVPKRLRENYLVWEEGRAPDLVIEVTSRTTRKEDLGKKNILYRDVLRVSEFFLFDPRAEYLAPPLQGYRLTEGQYVRIEPVGGRLPSAVLGLELEQVGTNLRLYDPAAGRYLRTAQEIRQALQESEAARQEAEAERQREAAARQQAEADAERLRRELEELRRKLAGGQP